MTANLIALMQIMPDPMTIRTKGSVVAVLGHLIQANVPLAALGDSCTIERAPLPPLMCRVISFNESSTTLASFEDTHGVVTGMAVHTSGQRLSLRINQAIIGHVVDSFARPLDGTELEGITNEVELERSPPDPLSRPLITSQLQTGVRVIDSFTPLGYGQRLALVAPAGAGKSTLLGILAKNSDVDVAVIALVGERSREVNEFLIEALGKEGRSRSVVVVATSDESALKRATAPYTATAIAEYFRDQGKRVLLLIDSLTRVARAIRDLGLSSGELPVRQGYTPSVYSALPKLMERAGTSPRGSITAIYSLLSTDESEVDPLAEEVKSLLDGHLVLSRALVEEGIFPALDPLLSLSRLQSRLLSASAQRARAGAIALLAKLKRDRDIVLLGGTADKALQAALDLEPELKRFMGQRCHEVSRESDAQRLESISARYCALAK